MKRTVLLVALCGACTHDPATTLTVVPRDGHLAGGEDIYSMPFPSDFWRTDTGLDLHLFPRPSALIDDYVDVIEERLDGWGRNAAVFVRFTGGIDEGSLPETPAESRTENASVYLVDVDPDSPNRGTRWPLLFRFEREAAEAIGENWLAALPFPGFPLDEGTTYALVVTTRLHSDGAAVEASEDWVAVRDGTATEADLLRLAEVDAPLFDWLDEEGGDDRDDVVAAAVFTTQHTGDMMPLLRERVRAMPAPTWNSLVPSPDILNDDWTLYDGSFNGPNFQSGTPPYSAVGGDIQLDPSDGLPVVQRMESLRFAFTIPPGEMPANGWPVALYAHGTGGSYHSFVHDGTATQLARQGIATISMDQVLHGPRNPNSTPEVSFFNFQNPLAARDNALQGAADDFSLLRFAEAFDYAGIRFDADKMYFFGHSQGGLTGPPFVAFEPQIKGAVLSGAGGDLYLAMLYKTEPVDITQIVGAAIRDEPLDQFNPELALLQTWIERADPVNYGPLLARAPADGMEPRPIFQTEGLVDSFAPPQTIEAFAVSIGGDLISPEIQEVPGLALRGREVVAPPVTNNLNGVTVVLAQYRAASGSDGHFVVFDVSAARIQSAEFLGTLASTGEATVVAP
jgi:hypothetical protein